MGARRLPRPARLLAAALLAASCAAPVPPQRGTTEDTVVIALGAEPEHLFAPSAQSAEALAVLGALTEGLVAEDDEGGLEARLAERVPTIENGDAQITHDADGRSVLRVRFRLREGAKWHDGSSVLASDLAFGWRVANASAPGGRHPAAARLDSVTALDERTVEARYRPGEIDAQYALCCNAFLLPEAVLRDVPPEKVLASAFARAPVYAGPFLLKERQRDALVLERSPHYLPRPALKSVVFRIRPDPEAVLGELRDRRADVATAGIFGPERGAELSALASRGLRTIFTPALALEHLDFNLRDPADLERRHPVLGAYAVRAALAHAIDRPLLARNATFGRVSEAHSFLVAPSWGAASPADLTTYPFNPALAEKELDDLGWKRGSDGVRGMDGKRLRLRLVVASGSPARERAARQVAADLARVGAEVATETMSLARMTQGRAGTLAKGDFDLALYAWAGERDPLGWALVYHRSQIPGPQTGFAGQNYPGWSNQRFSMLADEAAGLLEREARRQRYWEMQRIWAAALPALPLYQRVQVDVVDARLVEVRPLPTRLPITWNVARWRFGGV